MLYVSSSIKILTVIPTQTFMAIIPISNTKLIQSLRYTTLCRSKQLQ